MVLHVKGIKSNDLLIFLHGENRDIFLVTTYFWVSKGCCGYKQEKDLITSQEVRPGQTFYNIRDVNGRYGMVFMRCSGDNNQWNKFGIKGILG